MFRSLQSKTNKDRRRMRAQRHPACQLRTARSDEWHGEHIFIGAQLAAMAFVQPIVHIRSGLHLSNCTMPRHGLRLTSTRRSSWKFCVEVPTQAIAHGPIGFPSFIPTEAAKEILDESAKTLMASIHNEPVRTRLCSTPIETTYVKTGKGSGNVDPVLVFIHSFDSSLLEYRRLWPILKDANLTAYAVDILGWGFTNKPKSLDYGVEDKREHLRAFLEQVVGDVPIVFVGASVGGAVAIDFTLCFPKKVSKLILLAAQAFEEKRELPILEKIPVLASIAASVLKAKWLRRIACDMSYSSAEFRTEDVMRIGRIHTLTPGWQYASERFVRNPSDDLS